MSYQVGSTCYGTALAANQASASSLAGSVVLVGGQSHVLSVQAVSDSAITYGYTPLGGGALVSQTVAITPVPCNLLTAEDAMSIGWQIAVVWIAVYSITFIANYLKTELSGGVHDT